MIHVHSAKKPNTTADFLLLLLLQKENVLSACGLDALKIKPYCKELF